MGWTSDSGSCKVSETKCSTLFNQMPGCQVSYFYLFSEKFLSFPIFSYFSPKFLFCHILQKFSFSSFILCFSQKLKEASEISRISCSGKSHSSEIASMRYFPPKWSHDQPASVVLPHSRAFIRSLWLCIRSVHAKTNSCLSVNIATWMRELWTFMPLHWAFCVFYLLVVKPQTF